MEQENLKQTVLSMGEVVKLGLFVESQAGKNLRQWVTEVFCDYLIKNNITAEEMFKRIKQEEK